MPAYWWQCENCNARFNFAQVTDSKSAAAFIWDELGPSGWDQSLLERDCSHCKSRNSLRITYEFPRRDQVILRVVHIVGLYPDDPEHDDYVPMMWETENPNEEWDNVFDFKYVRGRNNNGLKKPAVFDRQSLQTILNLYRQIAGDDNFPY